MGDRVRIISDRTEVFRLQRGGHGGWAAGMAAALGEVGTVLAELPSGDLMIGHVHRGKKT